MEGVPTGWLWQNSRDQPHTCSKEREATNRRTRILEFGDEILHDVDYSKEHWDSILMDISEYEHYCYDHPHYMNNVAKATIKHIKHMYDKHLDEDSFL